MIYNFRKVYKYSDYFEYESQKSSVNDFILSECYER